MYLNNINNDWAPPLFTCVPALLSPAPVRFDKPFFQRALRTTGAGMPFKTSGPRCAKYSICVLFCKKKSSGNVTVTLNSAYKYRLICFKIICTSHTLQKRKPVKFRPCGTIIIELCLIMSIDYMQFNCKTHYEIGKLYCITIKWPVNWKKKEILRVMSNKISSIQIVYVKNIENSKNWGLYM